LTERPHQTLGKAGSIDDRQLLPEDGSHSHLETVPCSWHPETWALREDPRKSRILRQMPPNMKGVGPQIE
jgi:hypothetical protein